MVDRHKIKYFLEELGITELNKIKTIRENLGLSVNELADICDVSVGEISMVENELRIPNQIIIYKIIKGFKHFKIPPNDIFTLY